MTVIVVVVIVAVVISSGSVGKGSGKGMVLGTCGKTWAIYHFYYDIIESDFGNLNVYDRVEVNIAVVIQPLLPTW